MSLVSQGNNGGYGGTLAFYSSRLWLLPGLRGGGSLDVAEEEEKEDDEDDPELMQLTEESGCETSLWAIGLERGYWTGIGSVLLTPGINTLFLAASHTSLSMDSRTLIIECLQRQCTDH